MFSNSRDVYFLNEPYSPTMVSIRLIRSGSWTIYYEQALITPHKFNTGY